MRIGLFSDSYLPATNGVVFIVETMRTQLEAMGHTVFLVVPNSGIKARHRDKHILRIPGIGNGIYDDQLTSVFFPSSQLKRIAAMELDIIVMFTPGQIGMLGAYSATRLNLPLVSQYCTDLAEYIERYPMILVGFIALGLASPFMLKLSLSELKELIKNVTAGRPDMSISRKQHLAVKLLSALHDRCDAVVSISPKMAKELRSWKTTTPVITIPTGVDALPVTKTEIADFKTKNEITKQDKVVMYVGRLGEEKNLALLVHAIDLICKQEPNAKLVFVGDYSYRKELEVLASKSPYADHIIFTGRYPHEKLGAAYGSADVFVFPSLTDTQALVLNEAAHAGLPFVWIDDDLNAVLQDGKTGYQAKNNPQSVAKHVVRLLQDKKTREEFGRQSKVEAQKFTGAKQTKKTADLLDSLIDTHVLNQDF